MNVAVLLSLASVARGAWPPGVPQLPVLAWEPRSDWLSVIAFGAVGDGKHDDTVPIQNALNTVSVSHDGAAANKTVYFPAGTFLITSQLVINRTQGVLLIGTGRTTTLLWGGGSSPAPPPDNGASRLIWCDGANRFHIEGFVFDGANEGGVGLDHDSHTEYESRLVQRNLAFVNWRDAGIRVGHNQGSGVASAEMIFSNIVFANNSAGIEFGAWNDYDNQITGCLFVDNWFGIRSFCGNYYVSNSNFWRSKDTDAIVTCHASSLRRVVSVNSTAFLGWDSVPGGGCGTPTKLQSVYVFGWGNRSNASQAIAAVEVPGRGPLQIFDSIFEAPLSPNSSVVAMSSDPWHGASNTVILSNVTARNVSGPFYQYVNNDDTKGWVPANHTVYNVPLGDPAIAAQLPALSTSTSWFRSVWPMPGRIFDAVRDFNASHTGEETSAALQACIDAAAAAGGGAMCYLQAGQYIVNQTLRLCGADFSLTGGGAGFTTLLTWRGDPSLPASNTTIVLAAGPAAGPGCSSVNVTIEKLNAFSNGVQGLLDFVASRTAAVPASPVGRHPSFVLPGGGDESKRISLVFDSFFFQSAGGALLSGLAAGDVVRGPLWDGDLEVLDSAPATILAGFYAIEAGGFAVGRSPAGPAPTPHGGLLGVVTMVASSNTYDVFAFNSSSVAAADFYTETSHSSVYAEGDGASSGGVVALSFAKANLNTGWALAVTDNYAGLVSLSGATASYSGLNASVRGASASETHLALWGHALWLNDTTLDIAPGAELSTFALACISTCAPGQALFPDLIHTDTFPLVATALDAYRRIGIADLALNF